MKKILTIACLAIMSMCVHAQGMTLQNNEEEDTTIPVIGYFCKNDTLEYIRTQGKLKIINNDTTELGDIIEKFRIVVTDSTNEGYKMEIIPISCEVKGGKDDYQMRMASLLWNDLKDLRCRFTTDELGAVLHIENWREIRNVMKKSYATVFDSLYTQMPGLDSIMPRKQFESLLLLGCSTEDGIKDTYDELEMLFGLHGHEVTIDPVESDDTSEAGYPTHTRIESFYTTKNDEYDCEGDYVVQSLTQSTMSTEDLSDFLNNTFGLIFSGELNDSITKYMKEALNDNKEGLTVSNYEQYCYFYNGWPKLMQKVTGLNFGGLVKRVEYDTIEWTSRRWGVYNFPEEEDDKGI